MTRPALSSTTRSDRLAAAVAKLASAIAAGDCVPEPLELEALAQICIQQGLIAEAFRIRRWVGDSR